MRPRVTRALVGTVLALVVAWLLPALGTSAAPAAADETAPAVPSVDDGRLLLVLDSSGSMKERASGSTKIASAKRALTQVIDGLDPAAQVGLRVYGAKVFSRSDPGACTDSQLAVPVGYGNAADLQAAVDRYLPYGETPIGYALQQAADDLGSEGQRSILLVSDGEATCPPSPCKVAAELARQGIDVRIDVVGLAVSGAAREQLQCIAAKGKGTYYDADSADELVATLDRLSTRAFRPFGVAGTPVVGTPTPGDAPSLTPGAAYTDTVPTGQDAKHYLVERTIPGSTLHVALAARPDTEAAQVSFDFLGADESTCSSESATSFGLGFGIQLLSGGVLTDDDCPTDGPVVLQVSQTGFGDEIGDQAYQLTVTEEPPVADVEGLPEAVDTADDVEPWREGAAVPGPTPGVSFNDAPLIEPGAYEQSLVPGEIQFFRVPVEWGQQVQAQIRMPAPGPALADALGVVRPVDVLVYSPYYDQLGAGRAIIDSTGPTVETATGHQVVYRNRESLTSVVGASTAGEYYVGVSLSGESAGGGSDESFIVPYTLAVRTVGDVAGAPDYVEDGIAASPSASPAASAPSEEPSSSVEASSAAEPAEDEGSGILLWIVVGAIVLVGGGLVIGLGISRIRH